MDSRGDISRRTALRRAGALAAAVAALEAAGPLAVVPPRRHRAFPLAELT